MLLNRFSGMRGFTVVCVGQVFSLLGTGMTGFALTIWAYLQTGQATTLALAAFARFAPTVIFSPIAGALVDRWNRKLTMMLSDLAAGASTFAMLLLFVSGRLEVWHWYIAGAVAGTFESFQFPAYSAAVTTMIPKEHYGRASGMLSLAQSASGIIAPIAAGIGLGLLGVSGIPVIMAVDLGTFLLAVTALLSVFIPQPAVTEEGRKAMGGIWKESIFGFKYIYQRPSLLGLQLVFFMANLMFTFGFTVLAPMILARTGSNSLMLGTVQSSAAVGGVVGGVFLSTWGGPKTRVHGVLLGMSLSSMLGEVLMGVGRDIIMWSAAAFFGLFFLPLINGSNQAIWQAKVPPDIQGKVFAARRLIAQITAPVAMLLAGPMADRFFEPAMMTGGSLANRFGWLVGNGPGSGMALMIVLFGAFGVAVGLAGYLFRSVRYAEQILPDHDLSQPVSQSR